jgi:hypothetical protein
VAACPQCLKPLQNPAARQCVFCGAALTPEQREGAAPDEAVPWERWREIGAWRAFYETTEAALMRPSVLFAAPRGSAGMGAPLVYGVLLGTVGYLALLVQAVVMALIDPDPPPGTNPAETLLGFVLMAAFTPLGALFVLFLEAAVTHLALVLLGAAPAGFDATFRVSAYSRATWLLFLAPVCGCGAGIVWFVVVRIIGLAAAHGTGHGKAALAVLGPNLLCACCSVGLQLFFFGTALFLALIALAAGQ